MDNAGTDGGPAAMVERLRVASNEHNLPALVGCFAADYRNETPAHPERGFTGRDQVRRNWEQIFAAIPDLTAEVLRCAVDGDTVWTEWEPVQAGDGDADTAVRRQVAPGGPR